MIVLAYHSVQDASKCKFMITCDEFESHIKYFISKKYNFINLNTESGLRCNKKDILITFDDGYEDNYIHVFPIIKKYNIPIVIFLATAYIGKTMKLNGEKLSILNKYQIMQMHKSGLVHFATHTHTHIMLDKISDLKVIIDEIQTSKDIIEEIVGYRSRLFATPKGRYNPVMLPFLRQEFDYIFRGIGFFNKDDNAYCANRIEFLHNTSKVSIYLRTNVIFYKILDCYKLILRLFKK
ncbi:polysaccharide deacetylase family protein [Campylobacter curvus]|nr:polysaccharide deacetylase family protein [Campylobacter curvus]MBN7288672.1 polysaccharide deacetylase family protein [Campylobacter curvus]